MVGKILEIIVLLLGLVLTAAIVVKIPLDSYNAHKDYLAQIEEANKPEIKAELVSIDVKLNEGVRYFANDIAEVKPEHFTVTANYVKGEESYSETVELGKFTVTAPTDFYAHGGDVVIKFRTQSVTMSFELEPVVMEAIEIVQTPYTVHYAQGTSFDATGMVVKGIYNDGSSKILESGEYDVDTTTALGLSDKEVKVSYNVGDTVVSAAVKIEVSATVNDGDIESLIIVGNPIINAGSTVDTATLEVNAVYESGNRKLLSPDEYTVSGSTEAVKFGKSYTVTVTSNADSTKSVTAKAIIRQTIQGEDGVIVGGKANTEPEYVIIDGVITETTNEVSFAGNFSNVVTNGTEGSLTLVINSATATIGNITMRCGNSYLLGSSGNYWMQPLQINTILDLTINGREVQVPANVILKGCGPHADYAPLYGIYYEFTFENVELDPGENVVKFNFKKSTVGALNCWNETPSTMNIDYVNFDTVGNDVPDNYEIEEIKISDNLNIVYKQPLEGFTVPATATITGGAVIGLDPTLYDVKITGQDAGDTYFRFRTYTIEISLKSNPSVKDTIEYTVPVEKTFVVLNAYVELVDGKVYYVLTGTSTGYEAKDILLFDGATNYPSTVTFGEDTFVLKVDVSEYTVGQTLWPHIALNGRNYDNGSNDKGDVLGNGLVFQDGQSVTYGDMIFTIKDQYDMPTLVASQIPDFKASKDNSFESDKSLLADLRWGSAGVDVVTGTQSKPAEYTDGIGGMDKANASVTYTFTVAADGKVDFIWNVAGNQWKSGVPNLGITDMAAHMVVTLDGKSVDISGIELPAGVGTDAQIWWNIQQIVIKDVQLTEGEHVFKCVILADGAGLNIGAMEIYFEAN